MKLKSLQRRWNSLGAHDALWTILGSDEPKASDTDIGKFFQTGRNDIDLARHELEVRGVLPRTGSALDFGCGIGRMTQPMAEIFDRVVGVDIAPSMIEHAIKINKFPEKCTYRVNERDDLRDFESASFDFIISRIVLQHLPRALTERYLKEMLRLMGEWGVLVVQIPSRRIRRRARYTLGKALPIVASVLRRVRRKRPRIPMHVIPRADVLRMVRASGARVLHVASDGASGPDFESLVYYVIRRP